LSSVEEAKSHRLVVAEDDPDVLALLEESLSLHGYEVWTASDGREALACVRECGPDLVLLDTNMPGMDGYEVIRQLKRDEATSSIPIIVTTGSRLEKVRDGVRVLGLDVSQYVAQPFPIEVLVRAIKQAIVGKPLE
jgi:CheY-like chemotaxis protein